MGKEARVHIAVDTGFNRLGLKPGAEADEAIKKIASFPHVTAEGIFSHLALDTREEDEKQFSLFMETVAKAEANGIKFPLRHICDSIGMVRYPEFQLDLVRPGAFLYGMTSDHAIGTPVRLKCALTLKTRLVRIVDLKKGESVGYDRAYITSNGCRGRNALRRVCGRLPAQPLRKGRSADPLKKSANRRNYLHGSVHGRSYRHSRRERGRRSNAHRRGRGNRHSGERCRKGCRNQ